MLESHAVITSFMIKLLKILIGVNMFMKYPTRTKNVIDSYSNVDTLG